MPRLAILRHTSQQRRLLGVVSVLPTRKDQPSEQPRTTLSKGMQLPEREFTVEVVPDATARGQLIGAAVAYAISQGFCRVKVVYPTGSLFGGGDQPEIVIWNGDTINSKYLEVSTEPLPDWSLAPDLFLRHRAIHELKGTHTVNFIPTTHRVQQACCTYQLWHVKRRLFRTAKRTLLNEGLWTWQDVLFYRNPNSNPKAYV